MIDDLLDPLFAPQPLLDRLGADAWVRALVAAEAALARAEAAYGLIPAVAAEAITERAGSFRADPAEVARRGRGVGNPAAGAVVLLTEHVAATSPEAAGYVHFGATSQDIVDTAVMLVAADALDVILDELDALLAVLAGLAADHRDTIMAGRTLVQQALPLTFGLKAAGWLNALGQAARELAQVRAGGLVAQLGGAVGTLAALGEHGPAVLTAFAGELGLADPGLPWHTDRTRIARIGNALALVAGSVSKIAGDVVLLAQTEVAEVAEPAAAGVGGSSTMPHKRNPIAAVLARGSAQRVPPLVMTLQLAMAHEHERAAGAWHAEWQTIREVLLAAGGAVHTLRAAVDGLEVDGAAMRANLDLTRGVLMAESVTTGLTPALGRLPAHHLMQAVSRRAAAAGVPLRDELRRDREVLAVLSPAEVDELLDPRAYLGSAGHFVDRVLAGYRPTAPGASGAVPATVGGRREDR